MKAWTISKLLAVVLLAAVLPALAADVVPANELDAIISLDDLADSETGLTGTVTNHGAVPVTNVEVLVSYGWLWTDDRRSNDASPGWTEMHTLPMRLAPGESQPFALAHERPRPARKDGELTMKIRVVGLTRWLFQDGH